MTVQDVWIIATLGDITENHDSRRVPLKESDRETRHGTFPYYGASGIIDYVDDFLFDGEFLLVGEDGANLLARSSPVAFLASGQFWANNHAHVLGFNGRADLRYLAHFLEATCLEKYVAGTAQPKLTRSSLDRIPVPLPLLTEQRRIATVLDKADAIRRKREKGVRLTEELLRSTFLEMFGEPVPHSSQPLTEVASVVSGVTKGRNLNGRAVSVPYLRVANVQDGYLNLDEIKTIEALPEEVEKLALRPGDIVMTEGGDHDKLGRGAIWDHDLAPCIHQNHIFRVRVDHKYLLPEYFAAFLRTRESKAYFLRCAKKTTNLASINMTQLKGLPVPVPPLAEQRKFRRMSGMIIRTLAARKRTVLQAEVLFGSLVQRAFRGEL